MNQILHRKISRRFVMQDIFDSEECVSKRRTVVPLRQIPQGCTRQEAMDVFKNFVPYAGSGRDGYVTNFLGGLTDLAVSSALTAEFSGQVEGYPIPGNFHGDTLEWIATLRAVLESRHTFQMIELGAGWGPWCVISALAAKQKRVAKVHVIGVEGDAGHVEFMRRNFALNGLSESEYEVLHGVIGEKDGTAYFPMALHADEVYGGVASYSLEEGKDTRFSDFMRDHSGSINTVAPVRCFGLVDQLNRFSRVDLVHCDIQGSELELIRQSIDGLTKKVRRIVVGTHTFETDRGLPQIFGRYGWICEGMSACIMDGRDVLINDGSQVWFNPMLSA